jgi:hypothetical protein
LEAESTHKSRRSSTYSKSISSEIPSDISESWPLDSASVIILSGPHSSHSVITQSLEDTIRDFMKMTGQSISDVRHSTMVNTQAISKLEMQMGHLANHLGERDKGKLPSQSVNNPKACSIGNSSN